MHQKLFGGRAPPRLAGGSYSAPPDSLAGFFGGRGEERGRGRVGKEEEENG